MKGTEGHSYQRIKCCLCHQHDFFDDRNNVSPSCYLKTSSSWTCMPGSCCTDPRKDAVFHSSERGCLGWNRPEWGGMSHGSAPQSTLPWMGTESVSMWSKGSRARSVSLGSFYFLTSSLHISPSSSFHYITTPRSGALLIYPKPDSNQESYPRLSQSPQNTEGLNWFS